MAKTINVVVHQGRSLEVGSVVVLNTDIDAKAATHLQLPLARDVVVSGQRLPSRTYQIGAAVGKALSPKGELVPFENRDLAKNAAEMINEAAEIIRRQDN